MRRVRSKMANVADKIFGWGLKGPQHIDMIKRYIANVAPKFVAIELPNGELLGQLAPE